MAAADTRSISYLRVPAEEEWPAEIRELGELFESKIGFVPNIIRSFALIPDHFLGWWRYFDDLMRGPGSGLIKSQREMVAVVVSAENQCHYCPPTKIFKSPSAFLDHHQISSSVLAS